MQNQLQSFTGTLMVAKYMMKYIVGIHKILIRRLQRLQLFCGNHRKFSRKTLRLHFTIKIYNFYKFKIYIYNFIVSYEGL